MHLARKQGFLDADLATYRMIRSKTVQETAVTLSLAVAVARLLRKNPRDFFCGLIGSSHVCLGKVPGFKCGWKRRCVFSVMEEHRH